MIAVVLSFKKEHHKPCDTKTHESDPNVCSLESKTGFSVELSHL